MKRVYTIVAILLASFCICLAQEGEKPYIAPSDPAVREKLDRWQDLKFGVLYHWGIYTVEGMIESWSISPGDISWITDQRMKRGMDYETYRKWYFDLYKRFNPVKFDPVLWAEQMRNAGFKYMIFTTKHHDGFNMYDTAYSDYKITNGPFGGNPRADVLKYILDAFRADDFMVGVYYSKCDWHHPDFWSPFLPPTMPNSRPNYDIVLHPDWWESFITFSRGQMTELLNNYGKIDIAWLDNGMSVDQLGLGDVIRSARATCDPGLICVDRAQKNEWEDYRTPEGEIPEVQLDYPWETCMPLDSYSWPHREDANYKSSRTVINMLVEVVAKGGNLALGIGPTAEGTISEKVMEIMRPVGEWLRVNGEAIYNTRTTKNYHSGENLWFTSSKDGKTCYAICTLGEKEELPDHICWTGNVPSGKMTLLSTGKALKYKVEGDVVTVTLPKKMEKDTFAMKFMLR